MIYTIRQHRDDTDSYEVMQSFINSINKRTTTWLVCVIHSDMLDTEIVDQIDARGEVDVEFKLCEA